MLGPPKSRNLDRSVLISLEMLVPNDHFYRHLEKTLDRSVVRSWVKDCYAERGRLSIDPVAFFKLQLIMFFDGIRSERQLIEIASLNLAHRWYLGYNLDEPLPDHSSLSRIRERLGLPIFRQFFEHIVDLCDQAGLIWGKEVLVDATKVRGNASMDSLVPRLKEVIDDHLIELFPADQPANSPAPSTTTDGPPFLRPSIGIEQEEGADRKVEEEGRWAVLEACRPDPDRPTFSGVCWAMVVLLRVTVPRVPVLTSWRACNGVAVRLDGHRARGGHVRIQQVAVLIVDLDRPLPRTRQRCLRAGIGQAFIQCERAAGSVAQYLVFHRGLQQERIDLRMNAPTAHIPDGDGMGAGIEMLCHRDAVDPQVIGIG
jgi:transposase